MRLGPSEGDHGEKKAIDMNWTMTLRRSGEKRGTMGEGGGKVLLRECVGGVYRYMEHPDG